MSVGPYILSLQCVHLFFQFIVEGHTDIGLHTLFKQTSLKYLTALSLKGTVKNDSVYIVPKNIINSLDLFRLALRPTKKQTDNQVQNLTVSYVLALCAILVSSEKSFLDSFIVHWER